jgi:hypothetical protein
VDDRFDRHRLTMHLRRNSFLSRAGEHPQAALKGVRLAVLERSPA